VRVDGRGDQSGPGALSRTGKPQLTKSRADIGPALFLNDLNPTRRAVVAQFNDTLVWKNTLGSRSRVG